MLIFNLVKSQTFSNSSVSLQGSWNNSLTKTINVSGLSVLSVGTFELVQVNLNLGRQLDSSRNFSRYSITITSPTGQIINLVNNPSTFPNALVKEINTKFRDNSFLRLQSDHGTSTEPFHVGYYRSFQPFSVFNGINPNGTWTITLNENSVDTGARFNSVDLVFRSPFTVTDYTTLTSYDSCASPYCLGTSQIIVASNNGFTAQPTDLYNPNTVGCSWNAAQNNSAWFKFRALNPNVKILISGVTGNLQILGVGSSNSNPCNTSSITVLDGGCPTELINDTYLSPQYVNGSTKNNQLNLSGLTPGEFYYFIVDGTGGSVSPFYIEVEGTSPDCSNCNLNPIVTSNSPICSNQTINLTCSEGVTWSWTGPDGFTSNLQNPTIANASVSNAGIYTVVITDSNGCSETRTTEVIVNSLITPIFNTPNPICNGESLSPLPLVSNNGVSGTWSPALNNTTTTTYTFTPNIGECALSTTLTITVNNCTFGVYASAVWMDDCLTPNDGKFFNTSGSGTDLINQDGSLFTGNNYGVHLQNSNTLVLRGAEIKTFKSNVTNVCSARLNYRVYLQGDVPGTFSIITLPFYSDCNTSINEFFVGGGPCQLNDQKWQRVIADGVSVPFSPVNLTNLLPGNYVLEVYYDITGDFSSNSQCDDVLLLNNGGTNYYANFTIQANPQFVAQSPTTCNGNDGSIVISNLVANTTYSISYQFNTSTIAATNYTTNNSGSIVLNNLSVGNYSNFNFAINGCTSLINSTIIVSNPIFTPLFDDVNPICFGENIPALPTTSLNNITGVWTPSINSTTTTTYTFTPNANQCAIATTLTISVLPEIQTTTTSQPNTICNGASSGCVPTGTNLLLNEIRHYPTTAQGMIGSGTEYIELYNPTCNPIDASCFILGSASRPNANPGSTLATGGSIILPQGTIINPKSHFVIGTSASSANSTSVDFKTDLNLFNYCATGNFVLPNGDGWVALYNASGSPIDAVYWTVGANQANKISSDDELDDVPCTPNSVAGCSTSGISLLSAKGIYELNTSLINYLGISTPNPIAPTGLTFSRIPDGSTWQSQINPSIDIVNCNNGICDTLLPSTCNGTATVNIQTQGNYSYLWNDSASQTAATAINLCAGNYCVSITNLDTNCTTQVCVTVIDDIPIVDPVFPFNNALTICQGEAVPSLPTLSDNAISGTWSPSVVSATSSGSYLFTPNSGQCANPFTLNVTVNPLQTPTFAFGNTLTICQGEAVPSLPTFSDNAISGTWSPAVVSATSSGSYLFTPNSGQCANPFTLNVTVNPLQTPAFAFGSTLTICNGEAVPSLPTLSDNAISGTWSPSVVSATSSGSYLFTPNAGQCSNPFSLNVTVNSLPQFTITHGCVETDYVIRVNSNQSNLTYTWFNFSGDNLGNQPTLIVDEEGDYTVIVSLGSCSSDSSVYLSNVYCEIPKGISPNNDGLNDFFELSNLNVRNLKIYNRYGVEVYSKENYTNQWNGKCNKGNELPDATYYYVVEFNSGNSKTGWVYVNR